MKRFPVKKALSELTKPEHSVLVVSGRKKEKVNIMVAGWVMRTSFNPPLLAVSVGHTRYTHELMKKYDEFVLAYPSAAQRDIVEYCGGCSGRDRNKIEEKNIETENAAKVNLLNIKGCRVNFECRKKAEFKTGDHTIFTGEVVNAVGDSEKNPLMNTGNYTYREINL